jgi:hypothetical protein
VMGAAQGRPVKGRTWLVAVLLFFAWGFVMHATGLLLHELGGHALAAVVFGCGISGYDLTFFGHGQVHYSPCERWTNATILVADWAGLLVTIAAGIGAAIVLRRKGLAPLTRLLVALVAFFFLLGQLGYMTAGGFHDLYDPARTARLLAARGLHVLAWLPPLLAYAVASFLYARAAVDAFRDHFGSRTRLHALGQLLLTLGVAGLLYFVAFRIELVIRADLAMKGVAHEAERIASARHVAPPFPIQRVLTGVALATLIAALARPIRGAEEPKAVRPLPPRLVKIVAIATAACFALLVVLMVR